MSRNSVRNLKKLHLPVTPREGRVSRNYQNVLDAQAYFVTPREGRVSRNAPSIFNAEISIGHAPRGACE